MTPNQADTLIRELQTSNEHTQATISEQKTTNALLKHLLKIMLDLVECDEPIRNQLRQGMENGNAAT